MVDDGSSPFFSAEKTLLSFGRYKGRPLGTVSSGYLRWLSSPRQPFREAHATIWAQLAKRVLRNRSVFHGHPDHGFEKFGQPTQPELFSSPNDFQQIEDNLQGCLRPTTLAGLLQRCGSSQDLKFGLKAHHHIVLLGLEQRLLLSDLLLNMYSECGAFHEAHTRLMSLHLYNTIAWNRVIKSFANHGSVNEVLNLFELMFVKGIEPNAVTLVGILGLCGKQTLLLEGKLTHHCAVDIDLLTDVVIGNSLITMYGKCGSPVDACDVFQKMQEVDIVTWNAFIAAYTNNGLSQMSVCLYIQMQQEGFFPDEVTYISVLDACANLSSLPEGHRVHVQVLATGLESTVVVGTALVCMYGKCSQADNASQCFHRISQKNTVCWTAMIAAYAQNGRGIDALELFSMMEQEGLHPNRITFVSVLGACATSANLSLGEKLFQRLKNMKLLTDVKVGTALMHMFGRCGKLEQARAIFDELPDRDVASWNAMIALYAQHGKAQQALHFFNEMQHQTVRPDMITYVCLLSICSRAGLLHEAWELFASMQHNHGIALAEAHQNCMIDLLAKAGRLEDVENIIRDLPSSYVTVLTLLGACNSLSDKERGERMAQLFLRRGPVNNDYL